MPDMYLAAMQNAFQRHLDDNHSRQSMQDFITMCTRVAQMYHGFNASATALLHISKVLLAALHTSAAEHVLTSELHGMNPGCQRRLCLLFMSAAV